MNIIIPGTVIKERTKFKPFKLKTYLSVCIRLFCNSKENHGAIILPMEDDLYVFEAWKCVRPTKLKHWIRPENQYKYIPPAKDFDIDFAKRKAMDMLGWVEYNYWGTMFFQAIYQLSGCRWWIGPTGEKANKRVQCFQFIAILLKKQKPWLANPNEF